MRLALPAVAALAALSHAAPAPPSELPKAERTALVGATVHTLVPGEEPRLATVILEGDRIVAVEDPGELAPGTRRIDVAGLHIVPGLIDGYVSFDTEHDALYTAAGITCVRDVGGDRLKLLLERGELRDRTPGPRLLTAGALVGGQPPVTTHSVSLSNAHAAEEYLPILFNEAVDFLSLHPSIPRDAWKRALELAHERELAVWGPPPGGVSLAEAVAAGQDGFHFLDGLLPPEVDWTFVQPAALAGNIAALAAASRPIVPLVGVLATRLENQGSDAERMRLFQLLDPTYESWWKSELLARLEGHTPQTLREQGRVLERQLELLQTMAQGGVLLLPGSGAPQPWLLPGQALHRELGLWVRAGLAPAEVLRLATRGAAEILGIADEHGALFPGASADLVAIRADPTEDLTALLDPELVCVRGRVLERGDIEDLLATLAARVGEVRARLAEPLELAAPPRPREFGAWTEDGWKDGTADVLILDGAVETRAVGQRVAAERFQVWKLGDGGTGYCGRILYPALQGDAEREVTVVQIVRAGALQRCKVSLRQGAQSVDFLGLWTAGTWRMDSRLNGQPFHPPPPLRMHPRCVDVSSVTSLLMLGQAPLEERIPVLHLREGLEPELVYWKSELDDQGDHQIRTHLGPLAFRMNASGAPERVLRRLGQGMIESRLTSTEAFGGAGLPLPAAKRRAAEATSPAERETGEGEPAGAGSEGEDG